MKKLAKGLEEFQLDMLLRAEQRQDEIHKLELERHRYEVAAAKAQCELWQKAKQKLDEGEDLEKLPPLRLGRN